MDTERLTLAATVTGNTLQKSKIAKTPSVVIRYRTQYDVDNPGTPYQVNITDNLWLTYKTTERTLKTLQEVFGWKGTNITDLNEPILTGKKCNLVCDWEEYEGEKRLRVVFVNRPGGFKKMEDVELAALVKEIQPMVNEITGTKPGAEAISEAEFSEVNDGGVTEEFPEEGMPF